MCSVIQCLPSWCLPLPQVLLSLSDSDVVKLQGLPGWFPMCNTDPNLPPPPSPVLSKKTKRSEDIFRRVRRGTGYALASLRRPLSMGIDALSMEGESRLSPSSSMESLESSVKKFRGAHLTMPRKVKKERRPLSGLFTNSPATAAAQQNGKVRGLEQNGVRNGGNDVVFSTADREENDVVKASLSVPSSPLLSRRTAPAGKDNGRRKKLTGIFNVLKSSRRQAMHSVDLTHMKLRAGTVVDGNEAETTPNGHNRRWSLSEDVKHHVHVPSPLSSSSPYTSPQHVRARHVAALRPASTSNAEQLAPRFTIGGGAGATSDATTAAVMNGHSVTEGAVGEMDSLDADKSAAALLSDSSWYSAEEDVDKDDGRLNTGTDSRLIYTNSRLKKNSTYTGEQMRESFKKKSRSADDILDDNIAFEVSEPRESLVPRPSAQAYSGFSRDSSTSSLEDYNTADNLEGGSQDSAEQPGALDESKPSLAKPVSSSPKVVPLVPVRSDESSGSGSSSARVSRWRSLEDLVGALPKKLKSVYVHACIRKKLCTTLKIKNPTSLLPSPSILPPSFPPSILPPSLPPSLCLSPSLPPPLSLSNCRPKWLRRNRTHLVISTSKQSPLLQRRSSEPATSDTSIYNVMYLHHRTYTPHLLLYHPYTHAHLHVQCAS